jgi:hypothetical protein
MQNATLEAIQSTVRDAVAEQDIEALRAALETGATFASFTIRQRTDVAERQFAAWLAAGKPDDVREAGVHSTYQDKNTRLAGVRGLSDSEVLACFTLPIGLAAWYFADRCKGYGAPKANFALACSGAPGGGACFDSHLLKRYAPQVEASGWAKYMTADETLATLVYGAEHGHGQWTDWLAEHNNGTDDHDLLLQTMIGVVA